MRKGSLVSAQAQREVLSGEHACPDLESGGLPSEEKAGSYFPGTEFHRLGQCRFSIVSALCRIPKENSVGYEVIMR